MNIVYRFLFLLICTSTYAQPQTSGITFSQGVTIAHWTDFLFTGRTYGDPKWFSEKDVRWIAEKGLDHLLIRVSGREVGNERSLDVKRMAVLDSAIAWATKANLGVILHLQEFPPFEKDSALSHARQQEQELANQVDFWRRFAAYFSKYKDNVRFNIELQERRLPKTVANINRYNHSVLMEIRKHSAYRKVYLATVDADSLAMLTIPKDKDIILNVIYDGIPLFTGQAWIKASHPDFPKIRFPGKVPDLSSYNLSPNFNWADTKRYSNASISETDVEESLKKYSLWRSKFHPTLELYVPFWGYVTGWPFKPEFAEDTESIGNYARAFADACKKYRMHWAVYDFNSGMSVNVNDEPSVLLKALQLKSK